MRRALSDEGISDLKYALLVPEDTAVRSATRTDSAAGCAAWTLDADHRPARQLDVNRARTRCLRLRRFRCDAVLALRRRASPPSDISEALALRAPVMFPDYL
jgi:hypothetical protein